MTAVAVASGIACAAAGYWLGTVGVQPQSQVQIHVLEREPGVPYSHPSAVAVVLAAQAQLPASAPPPLAAPKPSEPAVSSLRPKAAATAAAPASPPVAAVVVPSNPAAVPVPLPVLIAKPTAAAPIAKAVNAAVALPPQPNANAPVAPSKAPEKPAEAVEVVLPVKARPQVPKPQASAPPAISKDYKVVNVIDGIVIVRQGQSVRQVHIGEKMPDGQTLKSVNTDKGQFETMF
ncbi:hypothetical protein LP417_35390 (plasmid) [Polaromonas sp. P1-6]|nr:hypothetical protein LP417_35390 [Polaromonas sp. P1-6]